MDKLTSKTLFWVLTNFILAVLLVLGLKVLFLHAPLLEPEMTVTVSAEGKATIIPDIATIDFSVISEGKDPTAIQTENTGKMNQAIDFVKSQGIDKKDIKTTGYNLYPKYDYTRVEPQLYPYPPGKQVLSGYTLTQTVEVKIRDLNKVAAILSGLPGKGVNEVNGPNFTVEDQDTYLNGAREEAFTKARAKVEAMAKANGVRVARVVTFSENQGGPIFYARAEAMGKGGGDATTPVPPTVEPGSQEVSVQVSVTYAIR